MDVLPKLTLKDIGCNGAAAGALQNENDRIALARIYGVATGIKVKEDKRTATFHESIKGNFRGKNLQEGSANFGKTFQSGLLYLPSGLQEMISEALNNAGEGAEVTFAMDIFAYKVNRQGAPYSYGGVILGEPEQDDALARLEKTFADVPALAAPEDQKEPAKGGKHKEEHAA